VSSEEEIGSRFTITLPKRKDGGIASEQRATSGETIVANNVTVLETHG
jgi:hypothetical protein